MARDLAEIKVEIRLQLPIRYSSLISRLDFRTAEPDEDGPLLPGAIDSGGENPYIEIPANYYRTHCLMAVWTNTMLGTSLDQRTPPLEAAIRSNMECRRVERAGSLTCLQRVLNMPLPALAPSQETRLEAAIGDSLFLIIAHEIGHVVLSHRYSGDLDRSVADTELAADAFALRVALTSNRDYSAVIYQLVPADTFANVYPTAAPPPSEHPSPACRLAYTSLVGNQLAPYIAGAMRWESVPAEERPQATRPLAVRADSERARMAQREAAMSSRPAGCELPRAEVTAMQASYRALLVAIDGAVQAAAGDDSVLVARLAGFRPETDDVRQLFDMLFLHRLDDALRRARGRGDTTAARAIFQIMIEVAEQRDPNDLSTMANFLRSMNLGIERFRYAPAGSSIDRLIATARSDLLDAERYMQGVSEMRNWPNINYHLGLFELGHGNCAEAARRFALTREGANKQYSAAAETYAFLDRAGAEECASAARRLRNEWRERRQWQ